VDIKNALSTKLTKREQLAAIEQIIREGLASGRQAIRQIGSGFMAIRDRELWLLEGEHLRDFYEYAFDAFGVEQRNVKYAIDAERAFRALENAHLQLPANDSQAVELAKLDDDERQVSVWKRVLEICAEQELGVTVLRIREAVTQEKDDIKKEALAQEKRNKGRRSKGIQVDMDDEEGQLWLTEKGEEALARIRALCGEVVAEAVRQKRNEKITEDALRKWAEQDDDTVRELPHYVIDNTWSVRKAPRSSRATPR
jgi:hypothetical protein